MDMTLLAQETVFRESPQVLRLKDELLFALKATPRDQLFDWGKRIAARFLAVGVKRVTNLGSLLSSLTIGAADELVATIEAISGGRGSEHFTNRAESVAEAARQLRQRVESAFQGVSSLFQEKPDEAAIKLLSTVLGFYLGIGHGSKGLGDGGIPDLDLTFGGIGMHRSIFTHSIIAGAFVETSVLSLIELNKTVHRNLPEGHSLFWDELLNYSDVAGNSFVTGASLGIASHLGIDTTIDGFTPYKDLPISLPMGAHELLMGMNAMAEGAYGAGRLMQNQTSKDPARSRGAGQRPISGPSHLETNGLSPDVPKLPSNLAELREDLEKLSAEERLERVAEEARKIAINIGADPAHIDETLSVAKRKIQSAKEPFRLGVIGEIKVGKSTLINALLGQDIAYTDILEVTASECRFRYGNSTNAQFIYRDRDTETLTVEDANAALSEHREDASWLQSIDHVVYSVDSDRLKAFDLWDTPGIGGNEGNEKLSNKFIERLGGALWVIDATLVGKASISGPLNQLKASGKPVICVINHIDKYQGDPVEIIQFIERSYPRVFAEIVSISALSAFSSRVSGQESPELEQLWNKVLSVMGADEVQGEAIRLKSTIAIVAKSVGQAVIALRRDVQDRIGLVEHIRFNLRSASDRLFLSLPQILTEETEKAFSDLEAEVWRLIDQSKGQTKNAAIPADRVIELLKDEHRLSALTETVTQAAVQRLNRLWATYSNDAFNLSLAALALPANALTNFRITRASGAETQLSKQAIEEGVYVGGVSAVIAGTIAAISTAITWPVILAAIPIGALAAWREQKKKNVPQGDFGMQVGTLITAMKTQFVSSLGREIKDAIKSAIETAIEQSVEKNTFDITGARDIQNARTQETVLLLMESVLEVTSNKAATTDWSVDDLISLLENTGAHLDIYLPGIGFSLSPLLVALPPNTELRVLVSTDRDKRPQLEQEVERTFGSWGGKKRVFSIARASGDYPEMLPTMIITADEALVTSESLSGLADRSLVFTPFKQGRMAAQRLFASLWEGRGGDGEMMDVRPVL